jgi:hypothetical protein
MAEKDEGRPPTEPTNTRTNSKTQFTPPWEFGVHEALTSEDRADIEVLVAAAERGFRLATRCTRCNKWVVAPSSVRAHMGPVCPARSGDSR